MGCAASSGGEPQPAKPAVAQPKPALKPATAFLQPANAATTVTTGGTPTTGVGAQQKSNLGPKPAAGAGAHRDAEGGDGADGACAAVARVAEGGVVIVRDAQVDGVVDGAEPRR